MASVITTGMEKHEDFKKYKGNINKVIFFLIIIFSLLLFFFNCTGGSKKINAADENIIKLGRYLFYDRRLSVNNTRSCGTCHNPQFAFTDGYKRSLGVFADLHQRNTQPLFNLSYLKYFTAADSSFRSPFQQMDNPLFNSHPQEMGVKGNEEKILKRIKADKLYAALFTSAFPGQKEAINWEMIKGSISAFLFTIISANSAYDRYNKGDSSSLSISQKEGKKLFFSDKLKCSNCHGGFNFSVPTVSNQKGDTIYYFNTGLYNINDEGEYPGYDQGLFQLTKNKQDIGKYRVPSLRNLAFTAPYFHDGSAENLEGVIDAYTSGGRNILLGDYKGDGRAHPEKSKLINGFIITLQQRMDLINFLFSLSDSAFINNPSIGNPFTTDETNAKDY
jgi:cytochrome c peroxidase